MLKEAYTRRHNSAGHRALSAQPKGMFKALPTLWVHSRLDHHERVHGSLYFKKVTVSQSSLNLSTTCISLYTHTHTHTRMLL